jgi:hypothetical protein
MHDDPQAEGVRLEEAVEDCCLDSTHQEMNLMIPNC